MDSSKVTLTFVGTIEEKDGTLSIIGRDDKTGKIYKFTNCTPVSCRSDFDTQPVKEAEEMEISFINTAQVLESSQLATILEDWRKYLNDQHVEI